MLDFFLSSVRKEPHLGLKRTFKSDCDAPNHTRRFLEPPGPFVTIPAFLIPSSPGNNYFLPLPVPFCAKRRVARERRPALYHGLAKPISIALLLLLWPPRAALCPVLPAATPLDKQAPNSRRHMQTVGTSMPHRTPATQMVSSIPCQSSDLELRGFVTDPTPVRHRSPKEFRAAPFCQHVRHFNGPQPRH